MTYQAPLDDIGFALKYGAGLAPAVEEGLFGDLTIDVVDAVLAEAGRLAGEVIAPLNRVGDEFGTPFNNGVVTTAPGWKEAYRTWRDGGWNGLSRAGGMGRPSAAAVDQHRLHRNVEFSSYGFCGRSAPDHRGGRRALCARLRGTQENLSSKARVRRMDRNDATHRAAGRLRRRCAAHPRRARA